MHHLVRIILQAQHLARLHGPRQRHPETRLEGGRQGVVLAEAMEDDANTGNDEDQDILHLKTGQTH